jgi:hypothetical protein
VEAHSDLPRCGDLVIDAAAVLEDVCVIEHGGAPRRGKLGEADERAEL